jgi:6-phosphogluconolactonase
MPQRLTRRRFLAASAAVPFAVRALAEPPAESHWVFIGTGTEKGIFRAMFDPSTGTLGAFEVAAEVSHPTYLALHPNLPLLYAANELPQGDGMLSSFKLERPSGELTLLAQAGTDGNGPCYVSVDRSGHAAYAANYGGGSVTAVELISNGEFDAVTVFGCSTSLECGTLGPVKARQDAPHMHCAVISPDNHFVLSCDLGSDAIQIIPISPGRSGPNLMDPAPSSKHKPLGPPRGPRRIATRPGSGPRHLAFHPNGHHLYCIYELDCTIELFEWSVYNGFPTLRPVPGSVISTLPAGTPTKSTSDHPSTGCELAISPNGKSLYANTRGANTLAVYDIAHDGLLTEQQRIDTGGNVTRYFTFDPSRRWLLCANQGSSTITVFSHDTSTGHLGDKPQTFPIDTPMFIQFL